MGGRPPFFGQGTTTEISITRTSGDINERNLLLLIEHPSPKDINAALRARLLEGAFCYLFSHLFMDRSTNVYIYSLAA
jgi:hypothetical protein